MITQNNSYTEKLNNLIKKIILLLSIVLIIALSFFVYILINRKNTNKIVPLQNIPYNNKIPAKCFPLDIKENNNYIVIVSKNNSLQCKIAIIFNPSTMKTYTIQGE